MASFHERFYQLYIESQNSGIKRRDFAKLCGATENQIQGWTRGTSEPSPEALGKIAIGNEVSLYWLVGISDMRPASINEIQDNVRNLSKQQAELTKIFMQFLEYLGKNKRSTSPKVKS